MSVDPLTAAILAERAAQPPSPWLWGKPPWPARQVAALLDVEHATVVRWTHKWKPAVGTGQRLLLDPVDVMICRAFLDITGGSHGKWSAGGEQVRHMRRAAQAVLADPLRWLALTERGASTFDQPGEAMPWWLARRGDHCLHLIDLQPDMEIAA